MASHLENLLVEYYNWRGFIVRHNQKVGRRTLGGWEMELDIIAYDTSANKIIHIEPSLDAHTWEKRESRFLKKFEAGRKYIPDLFPWLPAHTEIKQIAILVQAGASRRILAGATVITVDEMIADIREAVKKEGAASKAAIPEQYPLLRTIQFIVSGYYRNIEKKEPNKAMETIPVAVTSRAVARAAPSTSMSHLKRSPKDMNSWPFDQPKNCAVFTTTHVMKEGRDIIHVFHNADDHGWQFHYEGEKTLAEHMIVALSEIVQHDPSVLEVADLPPGWKAWRRKKGDAWQRAENPNEEEGELDGTDNSGAAPLRV